MPLIHNDYANEVPPKFEIFADRIEITSAGGLPQGLSEVEFFQGFSVPRNKELMRVFRDLDLVEQLGSGIPRILRVYSQENFHFSENFIRMVLPSKKASGKASGKIVQLMGEQSEITIPDLAAALGISTRAVEMQIRQLKACS